MLFAATKSNDLYRIAVESFGEQVVRFDTVSSAIDAAEPGDVLLVLSHAYPTQTTAVCKEQFDTLNKRGIRSYIEFPQFLSDGEGSGMAGSKVERVVVTTDAFGDALPRESVLQINGLRYLRLKTIGNELGQPLLVAARIAGFDTAVLGVPEQTSPLLLSTGESLVATTSLSHFRRGRYSPYSSWQTLWQGIFQQLLGCNEKVILKFPPALVVASYEPGSALKPAAERNAIERGIAWFGKANMIIHPDWQERVANTEGRVPPLPEGLPMGDGSLGSMEAVLSTIEEDGHQMVSSVQRGDCICETAMAFAMTAKLSGNPRGTTIARNLLNYYLLDSSACKNERGDVEHGAYGLIAWGITSPAWYQANYGDDNARILLASMTVAALVGEHRWDETAVRGLVANLRTTGKLGFRHDRIDTAPLGTNGWKHYFEQAHSSYSPHFQSYLWAIYLWAYEQTGDDLLLKRARSGLELTMDQYPNGLTWTNGLAQERARILLPLAWLVRVDDTPRHRAMLHKAVDGLLTLQTECGAIREELGDPAISTFPPPKTNSEYGIGEAPLIVRNGDPVADMLYTNNFALLGLHEVASVTGDPRVREAEDRLADFLIRIQACSKAIPEVDGGWMRAFDFNRWEPWGCDADAGWGAWSIESGWTQAWIVSVLAMRQMNTSLWDTLNQAGIADCYPEIRESMLPQAYVKQVNAEPERNKEH